MKIFLLEDDIIFSEIIEEYLVTIGHTVVKSFDAYSAEEILYSSSFDLLLMDINIPLGNGLELLQKFRGFGYKTPVIMITSLKSSFELEKAFELGCNDYIKKPFEFKELKARISNLEKVYKIGFKGCISITEEILFDFENMNIIKNKKRLKIPKKEAEIIRYFLLNKNRLISIEELVLNIWEYNNEPSIATIRTYIKNIRRIINKNFLISIKGMGYKYTTF